jgi:PAS domain S-box-containing protein
VGPESEFSRGRELELEASLIEAFLSSEGDEVFARLAAALGKAFPGRGGVVAWAESWGRYRIATEDGESQFTLEADAWARLPGDRGWGGDAQRILGLAAPNRPRHDIDTVLLRDKGELLGFVGLAGSEGSLPLPASELALLSRAVAPLQAFAAERVRQARLESVREMTSQALAKSERRFQDFIESSSDMIYIMDASGAVVLINKAGEELLGLPRSRILGRGYASFCPFEVDRAYFMDRLKAEGSVRDFEMTLQRSDSALVFVSESASAVLDAEGSIAEVRGIVHDITERIEAQREIWKANMELAEANSALKRTQTAMVQQEKLASIGQLAAGIAHEINNPLGFLISDFRVLREAATSVSGLLETARRAGDTLVERSIREEGLDYLIEEMPKIFIEMEEGFARIAEIVANLKTFARTEEDESRTAYDVNEGVRKSLAIARNEIKYVADVEFDLGSPPNVQANSGEINQVFLNLLVNAGQAIASQSRPERGKIKVSSGAGKGMAWVEIEDDGPGISEGVAKRIFEPFFTTKEPGKGTGLGLSISYDIITRKHKGKILFHRAPTGGTTFRIELPVDPAAKEADNG